MVPAHVKTPPAWKSKIRQKRAISVRQNSKPCLGDCVNFLYIIRGSAITLGTFLHNGIGPIFRGLLDQIFGLAPQRRVRLEPDHIHKKERQKY